MYVYYGYPAMSEYPKQLLYVFLKRTDNFNEFMRKSFFCVCNDTGK